MAARAFDEREFLLQVRDIPTPSQLKSDERDCVCGAFYNLYTVIGDRTYGVPETDTIHPRAIREEWLRAKLILSNYYKRTAPETISIAEMCAEVDEFLRKEFRIWQK